MKDMEIIKSSLPVSATPFIGRAADLSKISRKLQEPDCRLVTLAGPGGIGKTRFAHQIALQLQSVFSSGVCFVELQPISSSQFVVPAILDALNITSFNSQDLQAQLLTYLSDKHLLLILDNYEQLLENVELPVQILNAAPGVKLLVTSREVLNIRPEWVFHLKGLAFPGESKGLGSNFELENYDAVQLFLELANRFSPNFSPITERANIINLCRLVEGMPLALELAVSWLKILSCQSIVAELEHNLDLMQTSLRDIPARHRNIQTVFESSWCFLTSQEQAVLKRLSIFRGGFTIEAARQIAATNLNELLSLYEKSLIQQDGQGRYRLHELLRQYSWQKLEQDSTEVKQLYHTFSNYFVDFMANLTLDLSGTREREASLQMAADLDNIRQAWDWVIQEKQLDLIQKAAYSLYVFYQHQSRYAEGVATFSKAVQMLEQNEFSASKLPVLAELLAYLGWFYMVTNLEKASECLEKSLKLFRQLDANPHPGNLTDPQATLALVLVSLGKIDEAIELAKDACIKCEARQDYNNLAMSYYILGRAVYSQGLYDEVEHYTKRAYALLKKVNYLYDMPACLNQLAITERARRNFEQASSYAHESLEIGRILQDNLVIANCSQLLGSLELEQTNFQKALEAYEQSLEIHNKSGNQVSAVISLEGVAKAYFGLGQYEKAKENLIQALKLALKTGIWTNVMNVVCSFAEMLFSSQQLSLSLALFGLVKHHTVTMKRTRERATHFLALGQKQLPAEEFLQAIETGKTLNPKDLHIILEGCQLLPDSPIILPKSPPDATLKYEGLVEQLTTREVEILRMLAGGMTNQEIAEKLFLSLGTVKSHNHHIFGKLGARNRVQALALAKELRILEQDS